MRSLLFSLVFFVTLALLTADHLDFFNSHLILSKSSFTRLPNWEQDDQSQALLAFQHSCYEINQRDPQAQFSSLPHSGTVQNWQTICHAAAQLIHPTPAMARQFFEAWFQPYLVKNNFKHQGLFTGYYLSALHGSLTKTKQYSIPIYGLPSDLIKINLHTFNVTLPDATLVGKIKNNGLVPYPDRAAITQGAIDRQAKIILWGDNAIDIFFAQIQGSALVTLPDKKKILLSYVGDNGRIYTAIGKVLLKQHELNRNNISMQTIRAWLMQHPQQMNPILNQNASYVFFERAAGTDPSGTERVPLTPQRSLAVDTHYLALGIPIWLSTHAPGVDQPVPYQRLLVAQDTGGAIKGVIRGDIYYGAGENAAFMAGHMNSRGKYWVLLPR